MTEEFPLACDLLPVGEWVQISDAHRVRYLGGGLVEGQVLRADKWIAERPPATLTDRQIAGLAERARGWREAREYDAEMRKDGDYSLTMLAAHQLIEPQARQRLGARLCDIVGDIAQRAVRIGPQRWSLSDKQRGLLVAAIEKAGGEVPGWSSKK